MPIPTIAHLLHPEYIIGTQQWLQWRYAYMGGHDFKVAYLKKYSSRETNEDFQIRKDLAYSPSYAKAAINEVKNSIYERLHSIKRIGGSQDYLDACEGKSGGIDYLGSSMINFMGVKVLPELLTMSKVGIYVDMEPTRGPSIMDNLGLRPYLYTYRIEDIMNWVYDVRQQFQSLLLREYIYDYDAKTGFPTDMITRYRHLWVDEGKVFLQFFTDGGNEAGDVIQLRLKRIPFYCPQISQSLMSDVSDHQIALLNISSSDLMYTLRSNFPFYVEQFDAFADNSQYLKSPEAGAATGTEALTDIASDREIKAGPSSGRRYPINTNQPAFINPSPEPLRASMEKQEQIKKEIRLLLNLSISNLQPMRSSAESKQEESTSLETGLSYIGLELELAERQIAEIWADYQGNKESATVIYPHSYSLKSDAEIMAEAKDEVAMMPAIPSPTYQRELGKSVATKLLGARVDSKTLKKIHKEIDESPNMVCDPKMIIADVEAGLVDKETASKARCWPAGVVDTANEEFIDRATKIAQAQSEAAGIAGSGARGVNDLSPTPAADSSTEKKGKPKRGEGK